MLVIQPTSSGKGAYAKELAKLPNTLVVLACPFDKLVKQELQSPGSLALKAVDWGTLPMTLKVRMVYHVHFHFAILTIMSAAQRPARTIVLQRTCSAQACFKQYEAGWHQCRACDRRGVVFYSLNCRNDLTPIQIHSMKPIRPQRHPILLRLSRLQLFHRVKIRLPGSRNSCVQQKPPGS
jgi:hypothetical protein